MKRMFILAIMTLCAWAIPTQADLIVANEWGGGYSSLDADGNITGKAVGFTMDASAYTLDNMEFEFGSINGGDTVAVSLWSSESRTLSGSWGNQEAPSSKIADLALTGTLSDGWNTFTPGASVALEANTTYWAVAEATSGVVELRGNNQSLTETAATYVVPLVYGSDDPATWTNGSGSDNNIRVNGTIPEPATLGLLAVGTLAAFRRRRR